MELAIRVLIVDDHEIIREGLRAKLDGVGNLKVVGAAEDGEAAIQLARESSPDVILMDISMPKMDGIEATRLIHTEFPKIKTIILSVHSGKSYLEQALQAGAAGYVLKNDRRELEKAIQTVMANRIYISSSAGSY